LNKLNKSYAYSSCEYIEKYFIENFDVENTIKLSKVNLEKNRSDESAWKLELQYFDTIMSKAYIKAGDLEEYYPKIVDYILDVYEKLKKVNKEIFKKIDLHEGNVNLILRALKAKELLKDNDVDETINLMNDFVYDSDLVVDYNNDGKNDSYTVAKNNKSITFRAFIKSSNFAKYRGEIEVENPVDVTRVLVGGKPSETTIENNKVVFNVQTVSEGNTLVKVEMSDASKFKRVTLDKDLEIKF